MIKKQIFKKAVSMLAVAAMTTGLMATTAFAAGELPDGTTKGSITVHKFATVTETNTPGNGLEMGDTSGLGEALAGATFKLTLLDADKIKADSTPDNLAADAKTAISHVATTDATGTILFDNLDQGYYLLEETVTPAGFKTAASSIITLPFGINHATGAQDGFNYDIHVYPKNVSNIPITKDVTSDADKLYKPGEAVQWTINSKISNTLKTATGYGTYKVSDTLDERLDYTDSTVTFIGANNKRVVLTAVTDYTFTQTGQALSWSLTEAGIDKLVATNEGQGLDETTAAKSGALEVVVNTEVNDKAFTSDDSIKNGASMEFDPNGNGSGEDAKTEEIEEPDKPVIKMASVVIDKINKQNEKLDGAKFKIAASEADAKAGTFLKDSAGNDIVVTTGDNPNTADVEKGWAAFSGLTLTAGADTSFYLVETSVPEGYVKSQNIYTATIVDGETNAKVTIRNYKVGEDPDPDDPSTKPTFTLPLTGGTGTLMFTIGGILLMAAAVILFVRNKKRA